jgi:UDP-N-acetylmuramate: L-alanyl-gamma-D-glutamyl-meso-diaminopimelate ligase
VYLKRQQTRRLAYTTPNYKVDNGTTLLETPEGDMPIEVFWSTQFE